MPGRDGEDRGKRLVTERPTTQVQCDDPRAMLAYFCPLTQRGAAERFDLEGFREDEAQLEQAYARDGDVQVRPHHQTLVAERIQMPTRHPYLRRYGGDFQVHFARGAAVAPGVLQHG